MWHSQEKLRAVGARPLMLRSSSYKHTSTDVCRAMASFKQIRDPAACSLPCRPFPSLTAHLCTRGQKKVQDKGATNVFPYPFFLQVLYKCVTMTANGAIREDLQPGQGGHLTSSPCAIWHKEIIYCLAGVNSTMEWEAPCRKEGFLLGGTVGLVISGCCSNTLWLNVTC